MPDLRRAFSCFPSSSCIYYQLVWSNRLRSPQFCGTSLSLGHDVVSMTCGLHVGVNSVSVDVVAVGELWICAGKFAWFAVEPYEWGFDE